MPTLPAPGPPRRAPGRDHVRRSPKRPGGARPAHAFPIRALPARALRVLAVLLAGAALGLGEPAVAARPELAFVPGIAFAWTDAVSDATLGFVLRPSPSPRDPIARVESGARTLVVTGFDLAEDGRRLSVRVRATAPGVIELPSLRLTPRYGPTQRLDAGAAEVMALPRPDGPLRLERWLADDALGLYGAFALRNTGPLPVTVRSLRYAPEPLSRGLVLVGRGTAASFDGWAAAVLDAMAPAFAAFLDGRGRSSGPAARAIVPSSLAFPVRGPLRTSRWAAPGSLSERLEPGSSLFVAITPAAFRDYVDDLSIVASPVVGYVEGDDGDCCRLQGVPATVQHEPAPSGR